MLILPAIDILDSRCVRLYQGEYDTARTVAKDPFETVERFVAAGAASLHMVDLDGAKSGERVNAALLCALAARCPVPIELGGGIRDMETVRFYLDRGIQKVILGSAALRDPAFLARAIDAYGGQIAVGIDAKDGYVSLSGWTELSRVSYLDFAKEMQKAGVKNIIFTDISRDGTLEGPNLEMLDALLRETTLDVTASGGIKNITDIKNLLKRNLYGAIVGRSVYDGTLDLAQAIALCEGVR